MKTKKILTMVSAVVMAGTLGVSSLAGCNNKGDGHEHAYNYTTDYDATCVSPGQRTGRCVCGHVVAEVIPVDPDAHKFDTDWAVNPPSDTETGLATRTCKYSSEHTFEATLPKLSEEEKYLSVKETKKPTILSEGKVHYVYEHSAGNVEFDISVPKHDKVQGVEDVVALAASKQETIRTSAGTYVYGDPSGTDVRNHEFSNYYGDNYTRVHDGGNSRDFWYSRDDEGKPFGISAEVDSQGNASDPRIDESVAEENLLGFGYASGGGMVMTYGAEDTLSTYYDASQSSGAIKYDGTYSELAGGGYSCSFSFSRKEPVNFCRYYVEFTTFSTGAIKTLSVRTKIIRAFMLANTFDGTNTGEIVYDADGDIIFGEIYPISNETGSELYETNYVYEKDENGNIVYEPVYAYETKENGQLKYDDEGDPVIKKDENGEPITLKNEDGSVMMQPKKTYTYQYTFKYVYEEDANGQIKYDSEGDPIIAKDENGEPIIEKDENGDNVLVIAKDVNGAKIKYEVIGTPAIFIEGTKEKPDGTPLLSGGKQIARPVPLGWKSGDDREYYYEEGGRGPDGSIYGEDHPYIAIRSINFTQTLKVPGETVEENPYSAESVYIRSFDVMYGGKQISEDEVVKISANTPVVFNIANVQPAATAKLEFDPLTVYLKTNTGEIELNYMGSVEDNAYRIVGYFRRDTNTVYINAQRAGEMTLILRTESGKCERELKLDVEKGVPTSLTAQAYLYFDADGTVSYVWTDTDYKAADPETYITLYEGQSVYVRAIASPSEASYVDESFVTALSSGESTSPYITLEDNLEIDGTKVSKITAVAANPGSGAVGVYVNSVHKKNGRPVAYQLIGIKVVAAPSVGDTFTGSYKGRFTGIKMIESGASRPADVTVTFNPQTAATGTINVKVADGSNEVTCVYSYEYNSQTRAFNCTFVSGRHDETFQFEFALNEVYKITITHPTRTGRSETIVLSRPEA